MQQRKILVALKVDQPAWLRRIVERIEGRAAIHYWISDYKGRSSRVKYEKDASYRRSLKRLVNQCFIRKQGSKYSLTDKGEQAVAEIDAWLVKLQQQLEAFNAIYQPKRPPWEPRTSNLGVAPIESGKFTTLQR